MTTPTRRARTIATLALALALTTAACATGTSERATTTTTAGTSSTSTTATQPPKTATNSPAPACRQTATKATVAYRKIAGIPANTTSVDVYPVAGVCNAPVVMWVHGGGYQIGDKSQQIRDKVKLFNAKGWILVSVNYRLTTPGKPGSAQFPDHFDDVANAVAWVHTNIARYGGDRTRIALLGHSAGADIVSNVATNPTYLRQHRLDLRVLDCAGPLDTEGFDKTTANAGSLGGEKKQWSDALGNNPNYVTETSATGLIKPGIHIPPMIGVYRGSPTRQKIENGFLDALTKAGIRTTKIDARSLTHAQVSQNIGAPGDKVMTTPVVRFLTTCFR